MTKKAANELKIRSGVSFDEAFNILADGNAMAEKALMQMITFESDLIKNLRVLEQKGVKGMYLPILWERVCKKNRACLKKTLRILSTLSKEEVIDNLRKPNPQPFVKWPESSSTNCGGTFLLFIWCTYFFVTKQITVVINIITTNTIDTIAIILLFNFLLFMFFVFLLNFCFFSDFFYFFFFIACYSFYELISHVLLY